MPVRAAVGFVCAIARAAGRSIMQTNDPEDALSAGQPMPAGQPVTAASNGREVGVDAGLSSLEELLQCHRRRRSIALRNQIIERCREVVETMARTLAYRLPPSVDPQDLVHAGIWGLMQAVEKYEPTRCDQFVAFMRIRVRGAMIDELRNMDFLPRLYRRRLRDREQALSRLRLELLREPSSAELAAELGVSPDELQRAYQNKPQVQGGQGSQPAGGEDVDNLLEHLTDQAVESPIEVIDRQDLLDKIRDSLRPVEWKVLQLHYLEGMSGKEVARRLRLSASRICQIHGRVMDRLKSRLVAAV
jgi:RNA polymerase sigma factor for flagellar operon FliA